MAKRALLMALVTALLLAGPGIFGSITDPRPTMPAAGHGGGRGETDAVAAGLPSAAGAVAWIPVGGNPVGVALDPRHGNAYVTEQASANITILNQSTNQVTGRIALNAPAGAIQFNPVNGYLYVAESGATSDVAVVDVATATVVQRIPLESRAGPLAVDRQTGDVYVLLPASFWANPSVVLRIDGSSNAVVATAWAGGFPLNMAVNPLNGYVYITNDYLFNDVLVLDVSGNRSVTRIPMGRTPVAIDFDLRRGDLVVSLTGFPIGGVATINGTTHEVSAIIPAGENPAHLAIDERNGDVLVSNVDTYNVSVIDLATGVDVWSVPAGNDPFGIAVDPITGQAFVANLGSGSVSSFSVPLVALATPNRSGRDLGQSLQLSCARVGGTPPFSYEWELGYNASGQFESAAGQVVTHVYEVPGSYSPVCMATDASGVQALSRASIVVSTRPKVTLVASADSQLAGREVNFSARVEGGASPYAYNWTGLPPICHGANDSANVSCAPEAAGVYVVSVVVTDANGVNASATAGLVVQPSLLGMPEGLAYALLAASALVPVAAVVLVLLVLRRRRRGPQEEDHRGPE